METGFSVHLLKKEKKSVEVESIFIVQPQVFSQL